MSGLSWSHRVRAFIATSRGAKEEVRHVASNSLTQSGTECSLGILLHEATALLSVRPGGCVKEDFLFCCQACKFDTVYSKAGYIITWLNQSQLFWCTNMSFLWMRATWHVLSWRNYVGLPQLLHWATICLQTSFSHGATPSRENSPKQLMTPCHDFESFLHLQTRFKHSASPQTHENSYCVSTHKYQVVFEFLPYATGAAAVVIKLKKKNGGKHIISLSSHTQTAELLTSVALCHVFTLAFPSSGLLEFPEMKFRPVNLLQAAYSNRDKQHSSWFGLWDFTDWNTTQNRFDTEQQNKSCRIENELKKKKKACEGANPRQWTWTLIATVKCQPQHYDQPNI